MQRNSHAYASIRTSCKITKRELPYYGEGCCCGVPLPRNSKHPCPTNHLHFFSDLVLWWATCPERSRRACPACPEAPKGAKSKDSSWRKVEPFMVSDLSWAKSKDLSWRLVLKESRTIYGELSRTIYGERLVLSGVEGSRTIYGEPSRTIYGERLVLSGVEGSRTIYGERSEP